jgi:hypothetical protein
MKSILTLAATLAVIALSGGVANAGNARSGYTVQTVSNCVYKTHTCEVNRCRHKKMAYDSCGRCYSYWVTVVTYRDYYSNGTYHTRAVSYKG